MGVAGPYRTLEDKSSAISEEERRRIIDEMIAGRRDRDVVREERRRALLRPAGTLVGTVVTLVVVALVIGTVDAHTVALVFSAAVLVGALGAMRTRSYF